MCKYCAYTEVNTEIGESCNGNPAVLRLDIGKTLFVDLSLNRYDAGEDGYHKELVMDFATRLDVGDVTIDEAHIDIKYCPFCGERL